MQSKHNIVNSQFVSIEQPPAGIPLRAIAYVIDCILLYIYYFILSQFLTLIQIGWSNIEITVIVITVVVPLFYSPVCEQCFNGMTLGKKLMNIRVVMQNGEAVTFSASMIRWMLGWIDFNFFSIGAMIMFCNRKHQRLGDLASGAVVIHEKRRPSRYDPLHRFQSLPKDYQPTYPFAADFTWNQISLINSTRMPFRSMNVVVIDSRKHQNIVAQANKIASIYQVDIKDMNPNEFLWVLSDDYNYYTQRESI